MKISEIMKELETIREKAGDVEVRVGDLEEHGFMRYAEVESVQLDAGTIPVVIIKV